VDRTVGAPRLAAVALGSNLGDRRAALDFAIARLSRLFADLKVSDAVETDPEDPDGAVMADQPLYLNAVATGLTTLDARTLIDALLTIEADCGRQRSYASAPRTLDLDLILLGDAIVDEPGVQVPHPRFRQRFFVLGPLAEIAPAIRDPITGATAAELLRALLRDGLR
jgi:2-amino-4-hydroxy-6-hydroxymethyldihydropteridine diphosphokinase